MNRNRVKRDNALNKELLAVERQEMKAKQAALKARQVAWKEQLQSKIPAKVYNGLESAFCKGFSVVFQQGRGFIEKSYRKEDILTDFEIRDYAVQMKGGRKELRQMHKSAKQSDVLHLAVTTVEGIGLGALGIGMPDIVLFLGTLLKGIYETALNYGYDYNCRQEQLLILKMMAASLSSGEDWCACNAQVDAMLAGDIPVITEEEWKDQIKKTASVFAMDMLLLKFIQGVPVVGILGGVANPFYYRKIMKYVQLKYRKRYLHRVKMKQW